ncbi:hypothetical protein COHA_004064 [Chlorella ohadii]|uniref:Uncharacterized protein n=1 Tax=Chlorella ohadii TaxID=2649997 RepID=A0AAD5DR44_9CHLO|nr:hypothetical protein COHA_004064 [Chlorella ohadii]
MQQQNMPLKHAPLLQGGLMEMEKAVSAAANLDSVVLTAKLGVAAAAVKATYDGLSHLPDALKLLAGAAVVSGALALALRLARAGQAAAAAAPAAPAAAAEAEAAVAAQQQEQEHQEQEAGSSGVGAAAATNDADLASSVEAAAERAEANVRSS